MFIFYRAAGLSVLAALVLAGCASVSPDGGTADVQALLKDKPFASGLSLARTSGSATQTTVDGLLARPLGMDDAVRIALLQSPALQDAFATLAISDAERVQAAQLPNPVFAFERLREGDRREIDRSLSFNVLSVLALPWRARWAGQLYEAARLQAAQEVLAIAADARRDWVRAVAAEQRARYLRDAREAAEAGAELAARMAQAGNWSRLQQAREQSLLHEASDLLASAEQASVRARERLARTLGLASSDALRLPDRLPDLPAGSPDPGDIERRALDERLDVRAARARSAWTADALGLTRVTAVVDGLELNVQRNTVFDNNAAGARAGSVTERGIGLQLPLPIFDWGQARNARAEALYMQSAARLREAGLRARSEAREAWQGWQTAYATAQRQRDEVVPLRRLVNDEMLLRYNGMHASVWELLAEARVTLHAVNASIEAQRDFWLADTDLQLALAGSSPAGAQTATRTTADTAEDSGARP